MSLFLCDKCGVIENTALSPYWIKDHLDNQALCSECAPEEFDGIEKYGQWHGKFPREFMTDEQIAAQTDWSGWVDCERLRNVLTNYQERMVTEYQEQLVTRKIATLPKYPDRINKMSNGTRSQRKAKQRAKKLYNETTISLAAVAQ